MPTANTLQEIDAVYRRDARRVFATLEQWPEDGVPGNPSAWLVSAGRFKAIDSIRWQARFTSTETMEQPLEAIADKAARIDDESAELEDDSLRLIFTCCHPALAPDAQVALTLREVCGLTTEEIARAYLVPAPTVAQRMVRAKAKIRDAKIPYRVPEADALGERMPSVLRVLYLVFNEGYSPSSGTLLTRADLSQEAILGPDCWPLRRVVAHGALPRRGAQPRGRRCHAQRVRAGTRAGGRTSHTAGHAGLPPGPRGAGRPVPQVGPAGRGPCLLPGGPGADAVGARAPVPATAEVAS
jgi:RNA polymerase sigma factor (sigma-70 family)